ncbi:AGMO [Branchiostoma lanceolatum]|uniref:Transmembrane protein 195 n=1 Tax=Branchiostoma lanceolatum TaxID=7740 RepID=A0A8J9ZGR0_BRALA|nr:AGMO [Branchiostoma lanceolatum]
MEGLKDAQMHPSSSTSPSFATGFRQIFYLVSPTETTFETLEEVPNYVKQAMPFVVFLFLVETLVAWIQNRTTPRFSNVVASGGVALVTQIVRLLTVGVEMTAYVWLYRHLRLVDMSWDSPLTWWTAFFGVEYGYYWSHRMHHEVNILWAAHQVHHSSDDYNILSSLRTSAFQRCTSFVSNDATKHNMGKNFGGTLIIWDRLFGTFHQESGPLVYGLRTAVNTWDPVWIQFHHFVCIWQTFWNTPGLWNKLRVLFAGPGRAVGKRQLGSMQGVPKVQPTSKYDRSGCFGNCWKTGNYNVDTVLYGSHSGLQIDCSAYGTFPLCVSFGNRISVVAIRCPVDVTTSPYSHHLSLPRWFCRLLECQSYDVTQCDP